MALRLSKAGYWGGDPNRVQKAPVDMVLAALQYEVFQADYEREWLRVNREK